MIIIRHILDENMILRLLLVLVLVLVLLSLFNAGMDQTLRR